MACQRRLPTKGIKPLLVSSRIGVRITAACWQQLERRTPHPCANTIPSMRKWLTIFLLLLMPLQVTWAAASAYCQHRGDISTEHVGHHAHKHNVQSVERSITDQTQQGGSDSDCGTCHAGCSFAVPFAFSGTEFLTSLVIIKSSENLFTSHPLDLPERPRWPTRT